MPYVRGLRGVFSPNLFTLIVGRPIRRQRTRVVESSSPSTIRVQTRVLARQRQ